jgi:hypothetical protein
VIQTPVAKRRRLESMRPRIEEALRTECDAGFVGGLDPDEMQWLSDELLIAWNELDLNDRFAAHDRRRLMALARRLERAL